MPSTAPVLSDKDKNAPVLGSQGAAANGKPEIKSMAYHRQVLESKMNDEGDNKQYISPSDNIMSPCTAKLSAFKSKQAGKAKPKSLFAQASAKKLDGGADNVFGARSATSTSPPKSEGQKQ